VANVVTGQMLPPGVVKGGTALKIRVGDEKTRFSDLRWAFSALGEFGGDVAIERLLEAVRDTRVDQAALEGLGVLAREHPEQMNRTYATVTAVLGDSRSFAVQAALEVLAAVPDPAVVPALSAFLEKSDMTFAGAGDQAAGILQTIGTDEAKTAAADWQLRRSTCSKPRVRTRNLTRQPACC
jgi:hypothetical protein